MTGTEERLSQEDISRIIDEEDLETFKAFTITKLVSIDVSASSVATYMRDVEDEFDDFVAVGSCPKIYSLNEYQGSEALEGLDFDGRKAIDDLVKSLQDQETLSDDEVSEILEGYFKEYGSVATMKNRSEVEYSFRDLPFVNYDSADESYRLEEV